MMTKKSRMKGLSSPNNHITRDDQEISNERPVSPKDQMTRDDQEISNENPVSSNDQLAHDGREISNERPVSPNDHMTRDDQEISNERPVSPYDQMTRDDQKACNENPVSSNDQMAHDAPKVSNEMPVFPNDHMTHDDLETESQEFSMETEFHPFESENSKEEKLSYDGEMDEILQMVKAYRISSDEESSDDHTSDDFLVPEPPSVSGIMEGTSYTSSAKITTEIEENCIWDDMSSLTTISGIKVGNPPRKHEFAKERVEREGNIYDKLYNACLKGQLSIVKDILQTTKTILAPDEHGQTPLYAACLGNHLDIIKLLIAFGYEINHQDNEGKTPLHRTFENHDPDFAKILIAEVNASTEIPDNQNWTPLHTAVDQGYLDFSLALLSNTMNTVRHGEGKLSWIELHAVCFIGITHLVSLLLAMSCNVNCVSSAGYTPLHIAVTYVMLRTLMIIQKQNNNLILNSLMPT